MSSKGFASSGTLLFIDILLTSAGGWFFWIMISMYALVSEVGLASTIFGLIILVGSISQLGFEYPLLKKSSSHKAELVGTILVIELIIILVLLPLVLYATGNFYDGSLQEFNWLTISLLFVHPIGVLSRFILLGISDVRKVFIIDITGLAIRFLLGYFLISNGFGVLGILLAFLIQFSMVLITTLIITSKTFKFTIGSIGHVKNIFKDGLVNFPSKIGRVLIIGLSVVILAAFGISEKEVGIFYIVITLTIVLGGGLATSLSFMVIPFSSISKKDLSNESWRIGLSLTAPIIAALVVGPETILSVIGPEYVQGGMTMMVLAIGIFPLSIVMNAISKFNNQNKPRKILVIGLVELITFLVTAWALIPLYETLGVAIAILIAFSAAAIPSMLWSNRLLLKYVIVSGISILIGWLVGAFIEIYLNLDALAIIISAVVSLIVVISFKNLSINELSELIKSVIKQN